MIVVAALAAWLVLRSCLPEKPATVTAAKPVREEFHASKPLRVVVLSPTHAADQAATTTDTKERTNEWLERELRYLLIRGRMRVAPMGTRSDADAGVHSNTHANSQGNLPSGTQPAAPFTLQIELPADGQSTAKATLLAPDATVSRETAIAVNSKDRLALVQSIARQLPEFLGAVQSTADWGSYIGVDDPVLYENFIRSASELLGSHGQGFTQPAAADRSRAVQRLESLARKLPQSARVWSLLSLGYLSLGGQDQASLAHIAESRAERALELDPAQADARSALGLVRLRRGEWAAAMEYFNAALALDANAVSALEGSACLLIDVGHAHAALPIAQRAVALQPANAGASACLVYAQLATDTAVDKIETSQLSSTRIKALATVLSGDPASAQREIQEAKDDRANTWMEPLLLAASDRHRRSEAMRAITLAASSGAIDASTEILSGAALRQADFVFNRMLRLGKQNQPVPLRILWLPHAAFLRTNRSFEDIVSAAGLLPFWQDHGTPDVCAKEPQVYGCKLGKGP